MEVPKKTLVARKKSMATKLRHSLTDVRNENFRQNGTDGKADVRRVREEKRRGEKITEEAE